MSFNLITGRKGSEHVTSTQFRDIIRALGGSGTFIPEVNEKLEIVQASSTTLQVKSGLLIHHGCVFEIPYGENVALTLPESEGSYAVRVTWSIANDIESAQIALVAEDGTYQSGNMQEGDTVDYVDLATVQRTASSVTITRELLVAQEMYTASKTFMIVDSDIDLSPMTEGAVVDYIPAGFYIMLGMVAFNTASSVSPYDPTDPTRNLQAAIVRRDNGQATIESSRVRVHVAKGSYARLQTVAIGYFAEGSYAVAATCDKAIIDKTCASTLQIMRIR